MDDAPTTSTLAISGWDIVKFVLGTGITTAVFNQLFGWIRDWRKESRTNTQEATYAAMRLAVTLESFTIQCSDKVGDIEDAQKEGRVLGKDFYTLPTIPDYASDIDWKALDPSFATRSLSIRNEANLTANEAGRWSDKGDINTFEGAAGT
jgi:hypothetical protein